MRDEVRDRLRAWGLSLLVCAGLVGFVGVTATDRAMRYDIACDRCQWWLRDALGGPFGRCRRHPPAQTMVQLGRFPLTRQDDFCGEFEPEPEPPVKKAA